MQLRCYRHYLDRERDRARSIMASVIRDVEGARMTLPDPSLPKSVALGARLHAAVPGGAHTYAKGEDLAPIISHGRGAHVWDVDGNEYIEYGSRAAGRQPRPRAPRVVAAVRRELDRGSNFVRPAAIEVEAAERFLQTVPAAVDLGLAFRLRLSAPRR